MNFVLFFTLILLVYFVSYIPGRIIAQALPLDYKVKFAISFGLSYFIFFLFGLLSYVFSISYTIESIILFVGLALLSIYHFKRKNFVINRDELKLVGIFILAFFFVLCLQGLTPYYSGAESYWDWYEHYARSQMFLSHLPVYTRIGGYFLPQRMPLFNAAASFLMSIFGSDYWVFQTVSTLFNLSALLPCFLIFNLYMKKPGKVVSVFLFMLSLFLLNPNSMGMMITQTITKALASYYILLGLYFLVVFIRDKSTILIYITMIFLAFANLVHVVALPYIGVIGLFLLIGCVRNKKLNHFVRAAILYVGIVSVWYVWSYKTFGAVITFFSIRNIELTAQLTLIQRLELFLYNVFYSSVPFITKEYWMRTYNPINVFVMIYDRIITFYTTNVPGAVSVSIFSSMIIYIVIKVLKIIKNKPTHLRFRMEYILFIMFSFAGYFHFLFTANREEAAGASTMLLPTTLLLFSIGAVAIMKLAKKFRNPYIFIITIAIMAESLVGIGFKIYVSKYQLDPQLNTNINIQTQLYSLAEHAKYSNFAVHLMNYKLKIDNNLIFIYDKFSKLQDLFFLMVAGGWLVCLWLFYKNIVGLSQLDREKENTRKY